MSTPQVVRVLVVDDHEVIRRGLCDLLRETDDLLVCGQGATAAEAVALAIQLHPDVVILDAELPDAAGSVACRDIRREAPDTACLMFTPDNEDDAVDAAVDAGASGVLVEQLSGPEIVRAVRTVAAGGAVFSPHAASLVLARVRRSAEDDPLQRLTPKEQQVLALVAEGMPNRDVGLRLGLTEKTVKNHVSRVLRKLGLQSRTQLALMVERRRQFVLHGPPPASRSFVTQGAQG